MKPQTMCAYVDLPKGLLSAALLIFFLGYGIFYLSHQLWLEALVFVLLAALFALMFYVNFSTVVISDDGVSVKFLCFVRKSLLWSQVREVGIYGDRLFHPDKPNKVGTLHIYFSPRTMTEEERFDYALKHKDKQIIQTSYSKPLFTFIQMRWDKPVALYNEGDLDL